MDGDLRRIEVVDDAMAEILRRKTPANGSRSDSGCGDRHKGCYVANWRR